MNSFQLIITYLKFSILFVFEYPFYIDCLFTIYAVALHLFERTCKLCKKDVEDEIHFVCVCPALELIRMKYFKILNIDKSELLIDQLSRVLTHMNVNMVIKRPTRDACLCMGELLAPPAPAAPPAPPAPPAPHFVFLITL